MTFKTYKVFDLLQQDNYQLGDWDCDENQKKAHHYKVLIFRLVHILLAGVPSFAQSILETPAKS